MTDDRIESLASQIAFWRRAAMSGWEFQRRVLKALRAQAGTRSRDYDDRDDAAVVERSQRDAEIVRVLNGPTRQRGEVQRLADKYGLSRERVGVIARAARE